MPAKPWRAAAAAARRIVPPRARGDWLGLTATFLMVLLATTLLATGPVVANAVTTAGVRARIRQADVTASGVRVSARTTPEQAAALDDAVSGALLDALGHVAGPVERRAASGSLHVSGGDEHTLTTLATVADLSEHATLVAGAWPDAATGASDDGRGGGARGPLPAVVPSGAAQALELHVGDTVTVASAATTADVHATVIVSGIYTPVDPTDPFWWDDQLLVTGRVEGPSFTTVGPLVLAEPAFRAALPRWEQTWQARPDVSRLTLAGAAGLEQRVRGLGDRLNVGRAGNDAVGVHTGLPTLLSNARAALTATRASVLVTIVQLAAVAVYALLVAVGLLVATRQIETALLRARGAGVWQLTGVAATEGLAMVVPAVALAPFSAVAAVWLLGRVPPLAGADMPLAPQPSLTALAFAAGAGVACLAVMVLPAVRSSRTYMGERAASGRPGIRSVAQRAGLDLVLAGAALLALWQLRRYGAPLTEGVKGRLGIDPLLVLAPALGLVAGALLTLRLLPLGARVAERLLPRRRGLGGAVPAWQLARRPQTLGRAALLVTLAVAITGFALAYARTWSASQADQAGFATGADVRVTPGHGDDGPPSITLPAAYRAAGAAAVMGEARLSTRVSDRGTATLLAIEGTVGDAVVRLRDDLVTRPPAGTSGAPLQAISDTRPALPTVPLPDGTTAIGLRLRATSATDGPTEPVRVGLVLADERGMLHHLDLGPVPIDDTWHTAGTRIATTVAGSEVTRAGLGLAALELRMTATPGGVTTASVEVPALTVTTADGDRPLALPSGRVARVAESVGLRIPPSLADQSSGETLQLVLGAGAASFGRTRPVSFLVTPGPAPEIPALPVLATDDFLTATGLHPGDTLRLPTAGITLDARVVGAVRAFPTLPPDPGGAGAVIADLPTLSAALFTATGDVVPAERWWLSTGTPADTAGDPPLAAALRRAPFDSDEVRSRSARVAALRNDPAALGVIGALLLGGVAALGLAVVGFGVSTVGATRERAGDLAVLRALGAPRRLVRRWLLVESGAVLLFGIVVGALLAAGMAMAALPAVAVASDGTRAFPPPHVVLPALPFLAGALVGTLALLIIPVVVARHANRQNVAAALRVGEGQ